MTPYVPGPLAATHERLENWGRWARGGRGAGRAGSAEGRYLRERLPDDDDGRRAAAPSIDAADAGRVDAALAPARGFDRRASALLKAHYVHRASPHVVARRAGVQVSRLSAEFERALTAARHALGPLD
ncbi:MAG: hypothetical protein M9907_00030 [Burkholderiaceae bacterium]|nr:hypothetical protein [Burkholderiaceae bacterium]